MPCFKGLAVSIHADGPLPEYSIQKQSRASRISTYIPVPPAKVPKDSLTGKPEQSTFAISITLLTPGLNVPYSTSKPTTEDPFPRPRIVGGLPGYSGERGRYGPVIPPYVPRTTNPNETIAAYIYFDGRVKEEVATLLRRGEETWVNSRWVSVPETEGGGLAEREFLFREVGLERWLNGLDLEGSKDKQERIERRQRKLERQRRKKKEQQDTNSDDEEDLGVKRVERNGVLRYGSEGGSPVEDVMQDDGLFSSDSGSDDEPPQAEAAGQIKIALFRVLASGEIKRGEYSPQFDAHDDDDDAGANGKANGTGEEVDHTTSFGKAKSLDPSSISTQTVTGLDPPESPYAVFTFFYRGDKQLRKMGIISTPDSEQMPASTRKKSTGPDFSKLGPLKNFGTVGFSGYRDTDGAKKGKKDEDAMDSDNDDDDRRSRAADGDDDAEIKHGNGKMLSPEDVKRTGELAEGVQKIKLKRQHSADPLLDPTRKSPHLKTSESPSAGTPQSVNSVAANAGTPPPDSLSTGPNSETAETLASPFKRQRASLPGLQGAIFAPLGPSLTDSLPGLISSSAHQNSEPQPEITLDPPSKEDPDEELSNTSPGSLTPNGMTIRSRKLRGQPSKIHTTAVPPRPVVSHDFSLHHQNRSGRKRGLSDECITDNDGECVSSACRPAHFRRLRSQHIESEGSRRKRSRGSASTASSNHPFEYSLYEDVELERRW